MESGPQRTHGVLMETREVVLTHEYIQDNYPDIIIGYGPDMGWFEEDGKRKAFVTYCLGFRSLVLRPEGHNFPLWAIHKEEAKETFLGYFRNLMIGVHRMVIRVLPTLITQDVYDPVNDYMTQQYQFYTRLYLE